MREDDVKVLVAAGAAELGWARALMAEARRSREVGNNRGMYEEEGGGGRW